MSDTKMKNPLPPFRGMMPILPTAIHENGEVDEPSQRRLVQYCLKCGAVAIGHLGGASEYFKIADDDRRRLIEIVVDEVQGRVPVFIGATAAATRAAVSHAALAENLGADMLMVAMPYVAKPTREELFDYYRAVAEAVSIPIIIQDTAKSDALLNIDLIWRMYEELPNIHFVKAEGQDFISKSESLLKRSNGTMGVIGGAGGRHMIHLLRIGVTSFMTGTEALDVHSAVVNAFLSGNEDEAADIYYSRLLPYLMFYREHSKELLKGILHRRGIIDCPKVIPPTGVAPMSDVKAEEFEWILKRVGLTGRWPDIP
jgi:dihydrodipicolinate synthase/N-acetylneuraminate lyase